MALLIFTLRARAAQVQWVDDANPANTAALATQGLIDAAMIPWANGAAVFPNINGQGYDLVISVNDLGGNGPTPWDTGFGEWVQGTPPSSGTYGFLTFRYFVSGSDGGFPAAGLTTGSDGNLYGTTQYGGTQRYGAIFKISTGGSETPISSLVNTTGTSVNTPFPGQYPYAGLVAGTDGNLYGTTEYGGVYGYGTVFKITTSGSLTTLYSFNGAVGDGEFPNAGLVAGTDGNLYGTTEFGGANSAGSVFKITTSGTLTTLFSFSQTDGNGAYPLAALFQGIDGNLYGTTGYDGANGYGTVFKITTGGSLTALCSFTGTSGNVAGAMPSGGLTAGTDGNLYGTTSAGGTYNIGTVFKITTGGSLTSLCSFTGTNGSAPGAYPYAGLTAGTDGNLYGTTFSGGTNYDGTVFKVTTSGSLASLCSFTGTNGTGTNPYAGLIQAADGNFYGTTPEGGTNYDGTVFRVTTSGSLTALCSFMGGSGAAPGAYPYAGLTAGTDGNLYGTAAVSGTAGAGTVFKITTGGSLTTLYSFAGSYGNSEFAGEFPTSGLVTGTDGSFYGTTQYGGNYAYGTVFKVTTSGSLATIYSFNGAAGDGEYPYAGLTTATDGNLYGTTEYGGANGAGTVFKITTGGTMTTLYWFSRTDANGGYPLGGMIQGIDGNLYGTTGYDGAHGYGTVFKTTTDGSLAALCSFTGTNGVALGATPYGALIQANDGTLYGTTSIGGAYNDGTVFKVATTGSLTSLCSFTGTNGNAPGAYPYSGVTMGTDGNLYGTTFAGGAYNQGTVFQLTTSGSLTSLCSFSGANGNGAYPYGGVTQAADGNLYGTTSSGGANNAGTVFQATTAGTLATLYSFTGANVPYSILGTRLTFEDCQDEEWFGKFACFDEFGNQDNILFSDPMFSYEEGPLFYAGYSAVVNNAPQVGDDLPGEEVVMDMSTRPISGFTVGFHRNASAAGSVILTTIGNLYSPHIESWRQQYFGLNSGTQSIAGDTANPSGDGIPNLLKYAFGLDPTQREYSGLPTVSFSSGFITITFHRLRTDTDITYIVQTSTDLVNWTNGSSFNIPNGDILNTATTFTANISNAGNVDTITVSTYTPISAAPREFIRVLITRP